MENAEKSEMKRQLGIVFSKLENIDFDVSTIIKEQQVHKKRTVKPNQQHYKRLFILFIKHKSKRLK